MVSTKSAPPNDAGLWLRAGAKLFDHGLFGLVETAFVAVGAYLNALGHPPWVIGSGFVLSSVIWYVYVFELTRRRGQTLGKQVFAIKVLTPQGSPPEAPVMLRRLAVEFAFDMAPVFLAALGWLLARGAGMDAGKPALVGGGLGAVLSVINPLAVLRTPRKQALHDLAAGTFVVRVAAPRLAPRVVLALLCAAVPEAATFGIIRPFLVEAYFVPSGSMEPAIQIGDRILSNKLVYRLRPPRHHEIVMFLAPEYVAGEEEKVFVKRVVGLPGDRLQVMGGELLRNGEPVREPYVKAPPVYSWPANVATGDAVAVPAGNVVVFGDNRNNSNDSHAWTRPEGSVPAPFLPVERIRGKLVYRYWPPDRMGTVAQEEFDGP